MTDHGEVVERGAWPWDVHTCHTIRGTVHQAVCEVIAAAGAVTVGVAARPAAVRMVIEVATLDAVGGRLLA